MIELGQDQDQDDQEYTGIFRRNNRHTRMGSQPEGKSSKSERDKAYRQRVVRDDPLPHSLKIGDTVLCYLDRALPQFRNGNNGHGLRPMTVCGIWRKDSRIVAVDVFNNGHLPEKGLPRHRYFYDLVVDDLEILCIARSDKFFYINSQEIYSIPNNADYFKCTNRQMNMGELPSDLWPDLIARRALTLLNDKRLYHHVINHCINQSGLVREGFTLPIGRNDGEWAPDIDGGDFERVDCGILTPDQIHNILRYMDGRLERYTKGFTIPHVNFIMPPSSEWPPSVLNPLVAQSSTEYFESAAALLPEPSPLR